MRFVFVRLFELHLFFPQLLRMINQLTAKRKKVICRIEISLQIANLETCEQNISILIHTFSNVFQHFLYNFNMSFS